MNLMRIGQQLASRGHQFTLLLSAQEQYSRYVLENRLTGNTKLLIYEGDPDFVLLGKRREDRKQPKSARDPAQVGTGFMLAHFLQWCLGSARLSELSQL